MALVRMGHSTLLGTPGTFVHCFLQWNHSELWEGTKWASEKKRWDFLKKARAFCRTSYYGGQVRFDSLIGTWAMRPSPC